MKLKQIKKQAQKGFTMIELVIVIAILGILAAFALPRFANFTQDSQKAAIINITGSLNAALGIVKAKFVAQGSTGTTVDLDGNATTTNDIVNVTSTGDLNMTVGAESLESCTSLVNSLLSNTNGLNIGVGVNACYVHIKGPISYSIKIGSEGITNNVY